MFSALPLCQSCLTKSFKLDMTRSNCNQIISYLAAMLIGTHKFYNLRVLSMALTLALDHKVAIKQKPFSQEEKFDVASQQFIGNNCCFTDYVKTF